MLASRPLRHTAAQIVFVIISIVILTNVTTAQQADDLNVLNRQVVGLYQAGKYAEATEIAKRAVDMAEWVLGSDHPDVGAYLNNLAELYRAQSRYAEAEPLLKRSLTIAEKAFGPDHPTVGIRLNNLAMLYDAQSRYAEAEPLLKRALAIAEKTLGPDHPDVGTRLNNLAELYRAQGRYAEAEPLYKRAIAIAQTARPNFRPRPNQN
jgi:tetratricopeptide (TPR) repeat protein